MNKKSILVIEDNFLNMKLIRHILINAGYTVLEATNAEDGIRIANESHPNLILMDIQLPGMNGLEATQNIKKDESLKDIFVVALTSYAMDSDEENAFACGCDGFITKPIDKIAFFNTISQLFNSRQLPALTPES